jgi:hypothetical protein
VGFLVQLVKNTSLASVIGFIELMETGKNLNSIAFRPFEIYGLVAVIYFALCYPLTVSSRWLERRLEAAGCPRARRRPSSRAAARGRAPAKRLWRIRCEEQIESAA